MPNYWMVRAGADNYLFDTFEAQSIVGINFPQMGNVVGKTKEQISKIADEAYPGQSNQQKGGIVGRHEKFCEMMQIGDGVATYSSDTMEYLLGEVTGDCQYQDKESGYRHFRTVRWDLSKKVPRESLPDEVKNSLGSKITIFSIKPKYWQAMESAKTAAVVQTVTGDEEEVSDTQPPERQWESDIRDAIEGEIKKLSPREMERLVAALLKAMGYNSTVTAQSGDGGYDIYASPDGLLFEEPRIRAEVKHRTGSKMDVGDIRRFASAKGDARGVYVSTGGFTKEAITEARGKDITVLKLPQLAELVVQYYDHFDIDGRMLLPMKKIYIPVKLSRNPPQRADD